MIRWGKPKRYLKSGTRPQDFFKHLNNAGVRYLLLRWWKSFPQIDRGEDLDILVHADDYRKIEALLSSTPSELKCDVFTHDGTQSHRKFKGPYFPPSLASDLLKTRVLYQQSVFVPSEQLYFASLAYHAVFHKGAAGGLHGFPPGAGGTCVSEHDYGGELARTAAGCGVAIDTTDATALIQWLAARDYAPSLDMLSKLVDRHPELAAFAKLPPRPQVATEGELFVLVMRQLAASDSEYLARLLALLREHRVELLRVVPLTNDQVDAVLRLRGGNWSRGPYPVSGGPPHTLIIGYDWYPLAPDGPSDEPLLQNQRLKTMKIEARKLFNRRRWFRTSNVVHSPDNEQEALEYLGAVDPSLCRNIGAELQTRKARFTRVHDLIKCLSQGRRARTDLILYGGKPAVQKTYKIGCERFCQREIEARRMFAKFVPMPGVLETGEGYVIMEHIGPADYLDLASMTHVEKCRVSEFFVKCVKAFWTRGYFQADFSPRNFLVSHIEGISLIDFEFLQSYKHPKPSFGNAFEFCGIPIGTQSYDVPEGIRKNMINHRNWRSLPFNTYIAPLITQNRLPGDAETDNWPRPRRVTGTEEPTQI